MLRKFREIESDGNWIHDYTVCEEYIHENLVIGKVVRHRVYHKDYPERGRDLADSGGNAAFNKENEIAIL